MEKTIGLPGREPKEFAEGLIAFFVFATVGGAMAGGSVSTVGWALWGGQRGLAIMVVILSIVALDASFPRSFGGVKIRPPGPRRQVCPRTIVTRPRWFTGASWGLQLGMGGCTAINTWALWAMVAGCLLFGSPALGLLSGALYGAVRGIQPSLSFLLAKRGASGAVLASEWDTRLMLGPMAATALLAGILVFGRVPN